jgi:hypothetical protein
MPIAIAIHNPMAMAMDMQADGTELWGNPVRPKCAQWGAYEDEDGHQFYHHARLCSA